MVDDRDGDERFGADLAEPLRAEREVPDRFLEIGRAAFAWRDMDAALIELITHTDVFPDA